MFKINQLYLTSDFKPVKVIFIKKRCFKQPRLKLTARAPLALIEATPNYSRPTSCIKSSWLKFKTIITNNLMLITSLFKDWINKIKNCIALLTIIPVYNIKPTDDFMQAALAVIFATQALVSPIILLRNDNADLITYIATKRLLQGCIHEDGLADLADASNKFDKQSKLIVIKDSKTGVYGTLALMLSLTMEYVMLKHVDNFEAAKIAATCNLIGYSSLLWHWVCLPHAYAPWKLVLRKQSVIMFLTFTIAMLLACFSWKRAIAVIAQMILLNMWFNIWSLRTLGGNTGDTLGTIKLLSEMLSMMCLSA
ncbi:MAG: adenosylcobinamide-GDP ribazoletransferase [Candidatus Hodgkinia cicadicola]